MFQLDIFGNLSPLGIYLVRPNNEILGSLDNIIDETSSSLNVGLNKQYSISFDIRHISGDQDWFDYVQEGMYLFVDGFGLFKIDQPSSTLDGVKEQKTVTAHGCDSELENSTCVLDINMGLETSMEYLVEYDDDETESIVNPYTGVPYDWIVLYNTFPEQLNIEAEKLSNGYYGEPDLSGDITVSDPGLIEELTSLFSLIPRLKNKIVYTDNLDGSKDSTLIEYVIVNKDEEDNEIILSYILTSLYSSRINSLITFYEKYRDQLSLLSIVLENTGGAWTIGNIYGVDNDDYTLANTKCQFEINETIYAFLTQKLSAAINCIVSFDIINRCVNVTPVDMIGRYTGIFMGYDTLVNSLNIDTNDDRLATRLLVSGGDNLDIARVNFGSNYVDDLSYKMNVKSDGKRIYVDDTLAQKYMSYIEYREEQRQRYIQLSKDYEEYAIKISEIENKLPNDYLYVDWSTYTITELQTMLTNIKNLLVSLTSLYKDDYGDIGLNVDGSVNEEFIKDTPYWWDYISYKSIISQLECAITVFPYYNDQSQWTASQISEFKDAISSWETEWTLFGAVELRAKIETYKQNMDLLAQESVVRISSDSYAIKEWSQLTSSEQAEYGNSSTLYRYDTYMEYYNNMLSAQDYLDSLLLQEESLRLAQEQAQSERVTIVDNVSLESFFTSEECEIIYKMFRDSSYSNENILSTSIDSTSESIDAMYELLEDAIEQVSITSRPQLTFSIDADNLLANPELSPIWSSFVPGNYMLIEYKDGTYVKVRMTGYSFNPCMPSSNDLKIEFSNFIRSKSNYNDWASLLGTSSSVSGSMSTSSSQGGNGGKSNSYNDDIDVTISSTMLSKLLNTELFGTRVTDVILDTLDVNMLTAKTARFGGLANGTTAIDGKCIKTGYIIDATYNGLNGGITNTSGTVINLENGLFNFGGGKLVYNGSTLSVNGSITAISGKIGGFNISSTSNTSTSSNGGHIYTSSLYAHSSDNMYEYESGLKGSEGSGASEYTAFYVKRIVNGAEWDTAESMFYVQNNGVLYARNADITGKINASTGSIGGFNITSSTNDGTTDSGGHCFTNSLYIHTSDSGYEYESGLKGETGAGTITFYVKRMTSGGSWANADYVYYVTNLGKLYATNAEITGKITATSGVLGGFNITSSSNTGTSSQGGHFGTNSLYIHTSDGTYEYEAGLKADGASGNSNFYVRRIASGGSWNSGEYMFYITNAGTLYAGNATIKGAITATSLSTGNRNSSGTGTAGIYIDSSGNLYAGSNNQNILYANGQFNLGSGKLVYNGSTLSINGAVTATTFTAYGSNAETYAIIGDNITLYNSVAIVEPYFSIRTTTNSGTVVSKLTADSLTLDGASLTGGTRLTASKTIEVPSLILTGTSADIYMDVSSDFLSIMRCYNGTLYFGAISNVQFPNTHLRGGVVRLYTVGTGGGVYLGVSGSTAVTSDETLKDLYSIDDKFTDFFDKLNPIAYKYKVGHRMHLGFGAQSVEKALFDSGLDTEDFAGILIDKDVDISEDEKLSPDGKTHFDKLYSIRYEEFIALNTMMIKRLQSEVEGLKRELFELRHS